MDKRFDWFVWAPISVLLSVLMLILLVVVCVATVHAASSELLQAPSGDPRTGQWKRELCVVKGMEAFEIMKLKSRGRSKESMEDELAATPMADDGREKMTEMLDRAYAWSGGPAQFRNQIYQECMR